MLKLGRNMKRTFEFAQKLNGKWHTYDARCRATRNAVKKLVEYDLLEANEFNQFRIKFPFTR